MIERWAVAALCAITMSSDSFGPARAANAPQPAAAQSKPATLPRLDRASLERGRAVVVGATQQGGQNAAQPCFVCHGLKGAGDGTSAFPRIAGQPAFYLYKQLVDYATGARPNDIMAPISQALTLREMEDVAAYYAAQASTPAYVPPQFDPAMVQRGGALSAMGAPEKGLQACVNCHGPSATGVAPNFPYLAGQYAGYVELQLQLWQQGTRQNDPLNVMADIARRMGQQDVQAVAAYFASAPPPGADQTRARTDLDTALPPDARPGAPSGAER
jgi:cytochrome c553